MLEIPTSMYAAMHTAASSHSPVTRDAVFGAVLSTLGRQADDNCAVLGDVASPLDLTLCLQLSIELASGVRMRLSEHGKGEGEKERKWWAEWKGMKKWKKRGETR